MLTADQGRTIEILRRLVSFPSVSGSDNTDIVTCIAGLLEEAGIFTRVVETSEGQLNLWARLGPVAAGGIVLSGHVDVVPVADQTWSTDPWTLTLAEGKLHGRGACDMKGFVACCIASLTAAAGLEMAKPVYLVLSCDEEIGSYSVPRVIADMQAHGARPDFAVVGEPTGHAIVAGQKATFAVRTEVRGRSAHSSRPALGLNAIVAASRVAQFLDTINGGEVLDAQHDERFEPPHSTANVGKISGGVARNVVPEFAALEWDCRVLPATEASVALDLVEDFSAGLRAEGFEVATRRLNFMPGLLPDGNEAALSAIMRCLPDAPVAFVAYGTEAGFLQAAGWPAVVCGPGSIDQAHRPDEFVAVDELRTCLSLLSSLISQCARSRRVAAG